MRLKELEIQGFKSFPDKTKIAIGEGITGVVGPNGSGKSNISDSIRWVLGETSSKQLRGTGKMEDVIFGGTQSRGAMGFASVALTIDNSDHGLDMDADEVTIGRRYYRSGESEYSINGQNVRLKDVYELLLDTGIGRDGYAIVGQGRIAEIVGAKSAERREIFEEASGIAKYRYRKNEAERRLAAAEGNLERLRDILGELERRVGPLKRDSEKAQQFLELSEKRKGLEITLWVDAIRRANDRIDDPTLSAKIDRLEAITVQIFKVIREEPEKKSKAGTFLNYYLPTTQKLLDSYADFEEAGVSGENLGQAKARIDETMDNIIVGFEHQLDELYRDAAMDIDSDIRVMETMLKRDTASAAADFGLDGGTAVQMPDTEVE